MAWKKIRVPAGLVDADGTWGVFDDAASPLTVRYECDSDTSADSLVTKLNSVDYP